MNKALLPAAGAVLLAVYAALFQPFLAPGQRIGHDFSLVLPALLDGYHWYQNNGWTYPWFTPAFCGGQPVYADPQGFYHSPLQFLAFAMDPLSASFANLLLFAGAGFAGMAVYARRQLGLGPWAAGLAGGLWMFNSFVAHHYLVGHVLFAPFMLAPAVAHAILVAARAGGAWPATAGVAAAGLLTALCLHAGLGTLMLPFGVAVAALLALSLAVGGASAWRVYAAAALAALVALLLCLPKLMAVAAFMSQFPRTQYPLPGFASWPDLLASLVSMLSRGDEAIVAEVAPRFRNLSYSMVPYELAFNLTPLPLLLLAAWPVAAGVRRLRGQPAGRAGRAAPHLATLGGLVLLVLAVNVHTPDWNAFLKGLPILSSTSAPWRWFAALLPLLCAAGALALQRAAGPRRAEPAAAIVLLLAVGLQVAQPRGVYQRQVYDPAPVLQAYEGARLSRFQPAITAIGVLQDAQGQVLRQTGRANDLIARGVSQLYCYNPVWGYQLENFPAQGLRPGPVMKAQDGRLNLKNPACYVFPAENACRPGDRFADTPADRDRAALFTHYLSWRFEKPASQEAAHVLSWLVLAASLAALVGAPVAAWRRRSLTFS